MTLKFLHKIDLPQHLSGGFDHADVHKQSNKIYVAHTSTGNIEIIDGTRDRHIKTIQGCPEASGVLCAQEKNLVFAASRGSGKVLIIDAVKDICIDEIKVGPKPNGLAWDPYHEKLLVADVEDNQVRLIDPRSKQLINTIKLVGRPRWCVYHPKLDMFLINIREPAGISFVTAKTGIQEKFVPVSRIGPHGLDIDIGSQDIFIACDDKALIVFDISNRKEKTIIPLSGEPDVIWLNNKKDILYCAAGKPGIVDVINTKKYALIEKVQTEEGAHTLTFNSNNQQLYVFFPKTCCASVYKEV